MQKRVVCHPSATQILKKEYREILNKAKEEYEYIPASDYYKDGYNLYLRKAVSFRSFERIGHLCECMSMLVMMHQEERANLFAQVSQVFG